MNVGMIGVGAMGSAMAGHIRARSDHTVVVHDVDAAQLAAVAVDGVVAAGSLAELAACAELAIVMVSTDEQVREVVDELLEHGRPGLLIVVASTNSPGMMEALDVAVRAGGMRIIDAPVVFGLQGAREGRLVSLCGGGEADVAEAEPVLACYSRKVFRMGPIGKGMLTKTVNNMLHWAACLANFEAIALGKTYGLDGQFLREVLLECPGTNGTLARWDATRFTWHEKDMDIAMGMAQDADLMLPFYGLVDQLIKHLEPAQVAGLLHERTTDYLGQSVPPAGEH